VYTINAEFQRFRDINLVELIGASGVYVIWDARSKARPTYIGEGNILKRLVEHAERFALPLDGYVAPLDGLTWQRDKADAEIIEVRLNEIDQEERVMLVERVP